jgi:hypothetical protein
VGYPPASAEGYVAYAISARDHRVSMKMTHLGNQETTIRSSLLVVFGNEVVRRSTWNRSSVSGQGGHDYTVLELKLSDVP